MLGLIKVKSFEFCFCLFFSSVDASSGQCELIKKIMQEAIPIQRVRLLAAHFCLHETTNLLLTHLFLSTVLPLL